MLRTIRILALVLILLLGGFWTWAWVARAPGQDLGAALAGRLESLFGAQPVVSLGGVQLPGGVELGGPFALVDQDGREVTQVDYAGRWMLVYFGYTYCPDVCPTELGAMAAAMDLLGPRAERVAPVFITIDPERDTPETLRAYVAQFHPRLQGLTGTPEATGAVARRYRVYHAQARRQGDTPYLVDHSSFIYLVGPDGRVRTLFRPQTPPEAMAASMAGLIGP